MQTADSSRAKNARFGMTVRNSKKGESSERRGFRVLLHTITRSADHPMTQSPDHSITHSPDLVGPIMKQHCHPEWPICGPRDLLFNGVRKSRFLAPKIARFGMTVRNSKKGESRERRRFRV